MQHEFLSLAPKIQSWISDATARQHLAQTNAQAPPEFAEKKEWSNKAHMPAAVAVISPCYELEKL